MCEDDEWDEKKEKEKKSRALPVRVFYQSASAVPCGIHLVVPPQARSTKQQCPLLLSRVSYVLLNQMRTQPKNVNHNAKFSLQQQTAYYYNIGSRSLIPGIIVSLLLKLTSLQSGL